MNTTQGSACFSNDMQYRYELTRTFDLDQAGAAGAIFIMLNPSTADAEKNDPTIARCCKYAQAWGFHNMTVLNLFALRSTDPKALYTHPDPVGPDNDVMIHAFLHEHRKHVPVPRVVCAWGNDGAFMDRGEQVRKLIQACGVRPSYLKMNKTGQPSHPLYLPGGLTPTNWV